MTKVVWIILFLSLAFMAWWKWDCIEYDRDLESQHIKETGLSWNDIEKGVSKK